MYLRHQRQTVRPASARHASEPESWTSAGGVVLRELDDGRLDLVLVGRGRRVRWTLPKGTRRPDEPLERTALREVHEETGLLVRLLQAVGRIHYTFVLGGVRYDKTVDFYLMQAVGGDTADHDDEYDFAQWFSVGDAVQQMAYPNEVCIVEKAIGVLAAERGPSATAVSAISPAPRAASDPGG
jgi:8-oxo-dGTP pyrophosphatase MutT (NUDIX family)